MSDSTTVIASFFFGIQSTIGNVQPLASSAISVDGQNYTFPLQGLPARSTPTLSYGTISGQKMLTLPPGTHEIKVLYGMLNGTAFTRMQQRELQVLIFGDGSSL